MEKTFQEKIQKELFDFLAIPSISAQPDHHQDCIDAAHFVENALRTRGFESQIIPTGDPKRSLPVVYGEWTPPNFSPDKPTLLVYGHYDVQPPDPLDLWDHPPFEPHMKDHCVYARGASDNKGQIFALIAGLGLAIEEHPDLPVRIRMIIEGEEEVGSSNLEPFIQSHKDMLESQVVLISDSAQLGPNQPAICYGLKGLTYFQCTVTGPQLDLHSGCFGGLVANPALVLCNVLDQCHDESTGKVQIPGFYDDVVDLDEDERSMMASLPFHEADLLRYLGRDDFYGDQDYTPLERKSARPTFDVHGLTSGYQKEGAKTVIPSQASAKFGFRLVGNQDPQRIENLVEDFFRKTMPSHVSYKLEKFHSCDPVLINRKSPFMQVAERSILAAFGIQPVYIREGGSIPIVSLFEKVLGSFPILIGLGQPTDQIHSPNEHLSMVDFFRGVEMAKHFPEELSRC